MRRILLAGAAIVLIGAVYAVRTVSNFELDGPPRIEATLTGVDLPVSTIMAQVEVPTAPLGDLITEKLTRDAQEGYKPLAQGNTERLALDKVRDILGLDIIDRERCEPTAAARLAKRADACWKDAGQDGFRKAQCITKFGVDVLDTAVRVADECVIRSVRTRLPDRPTQLGYVLHLDDLSLKMAGRTLGVRASVRVDLDPPDTIFEYFQRKGQDDAAKCAGFITADARFGLDVASVDSALGFDVTAQAVELSPGKACPGQSVAPIMQDLEKVLFKAVSEVFQGPLQSALQDALNDPKLTDDLNGHLQILAQVLDQPLPVPLEDIPVPAGLALNASALVISQVQGGRGSIGLSAGLEAKPLLSLTEVPPLKGFDAFQQNPEAALPVRVAVPDDRFVLRAQMQLQLDSVSDIATTVVRDVIETHLPDLRYGDVQAELYQAGERMVIGVHLTQVGRLRVSGSVYLTAKPEFDQARQSVRLRDIKFDVTSERFLLSRAGWALEAPIAGALEDRLSFPLSGPMAQAVSALTSLEIPLQDQQGRLLATLHTGLEEVAPEQIWLSENAMNVSVLAVGRARVEVAPDALKMLR